MAFRSDTNNRELPNTSVETKLNGEISGYDYSIGVPDLETEYVERELEGLDVEIFEDQIRLRDGVKILYQEKDQDQVYDLIL